MSNSEANEQFHDEELAAKLAPLFTLLKTVRPFLATNDNYLPGETDDEFEVRWNREAAIVQKARVDIDAALGKGDADGGREEGK